MNITCVFVYVVIYMQIYICTLSQHYDRNLVYWKYCTSHYPVPTLVLAQYLTGYLAKSGSKWIPKTESVTSIKHTFQNAEHANNQVWAGKVLECKRNSVMNFVRSLNFFQDRNNEANRHELAQLVDEIKWSVVDTVPAENTLWRHKQRKNSSYNYAVLI